MVRPEASAAEHGSTVQAWSAPMIAGLTAMGRRTPGEMQGAERRAWQEAEAAGRAAGLEAARADIEARTRKLDAATRRMETALQALSRPLAHLDDNIHEQITRLAVALARALVRRELRTDPAQIIGIVRETVSLLPASTRGVRVLLHPEDANLVRELLSTAGPEQAWAIVDDPVLARGDCRVQTDYALIDSRLDARLYEALAQLLGEERGRPREVIE
jgi:flagellar assembly protein FliH